MPVAAFFCAVVSALCYTLALILVCKSFEVEDLSLIYPLSRSEPLFATIWAILFFRERLSPLGLIGIAVTCMGVYTIQLRGLSLRAVLSPIRSLETKTSRLALLAAIISSVAAYFDKSALGAVSPFTYVFWLFLLMVMFYTLYIAMRKAQSSISNHWERERGSIFLGGFLGTSYLLLLIAMTMSKVSYVLTVRQVSIVIGTVLGVWLLREEYGIIRIVSSVLICSGIIMIGLA